MAEKRMFSKQIVDSDKFLSLSLSSQALYFHLAMRADDDGFIDNPKKTVRIIGAHEEDLGDLEKAEFIIVFESGIVCVKHWRLHNIIKSDRYKSTIYQQEKKLLKEENKVYFLIPTKSDDSKETVPAAKNSKFEMSNSELESGKGDYEYTERVTVPSVDEPYFNDAELENTESWNQSGTKVEPKWNQSGTKVEPQIRVDNISIDKDRVDSRKVSNILNNTATATKKSDLVGEDDNYSSAKKVTVPSATKPTIEELIRYAEVKKLNSVDVEKFFEYYSARNWRDSKGCFINWRGKMRDWQKSERKFTKSNNPFLELMKE